MTLRRFDAAVAWEPEADGRPSQRLFAGSRIMAGFLSLRLASRRIQGGGVQDFYD